MSCWIINSCRKKKKYSNNEYSKNEKHSFDNNIFMIGFGTPEENRDKKKGNTTIKQFDKFKKEVNINDTIYLYANKTGIIAKGKFSHIIENIEDKDKAPDWSKDEKQTHIKIDKWEIFKDPLKYKPRPLTLYLEKNEI